jgi:hypothetical protein
VSRVLSISLNLAVIVLDRRGVKCDGLKRKLRMVMVTQIMNFDQDAGIFLDNPGP